MKEYLTSDHLANNVRMARSIDSRAVMLVEGATDARFFERFVDLDGCKVIAAHDRKRAIGALRLLNTAAFEGVFAVVDADFARVTSLLESDSNLLFCDGHDLEIMLLRSRALDHVVGEHASNEKLSSFLVSRQPAILASILTNAAAPLGALVLHSLQNDLGLTFEGLNFKDFVNAKTLDVDVDKLIQCVMNKSSRHDKGLAQDLKLGIARIVGHAQDSAELARGHDCIEVLAVALTATIGTKKSRTDERKRTSITPELLERELRLAFGDSEFFATSLYRHIVEWQSDDPDIEIVLRQPR